jgi:hypothetical protein
MEGAIRALKSRRNSLSVISRLPPEIHSFVAQRHMSPCSSPWIGLQHELLRVPEPIVLQYEYPTDSEPISFTKNNTAHKSFIGFKLFKLGRIQVTRRCSLGCSAR